MRFGGRGLVRVVRARAATWLMCYVPTKIEIHGCVHDYTESIHSYNKDFLIRLCLHIDLLLACCLFQMGVKKAEFELFRKTLLMQRLRTRCGRRRPVWLAVPRLSSSALSFAVSDAFALSLI